MSVFWCRVLYIAATLIPLSFLRFVHLFPEDPKIKELFIQTSGIFSLISLLFIVALIISPHLIIENVNIRAGQEKQIIWGSLYFLYVIYITGYFAWALWSLFKKLLKATGNLKIQLKYVFLGTSTSIILGSTFNLFLPTFGYFQLNWLGQVTTLFMVAFVSYAIERYQLLGIRVILTEILIVAIALILLTQAILANTFWGNIVGFSVFGLFLIFGYLLIRSVLREIKTREKMEELALDLERANTQLMKLDKARTEFMSMASHQLRTPLTAIKGYISLAMEGQYGEMPKALREKLKNVYLSNERLINLVGDLLTVSRIEMGKLTAEKEPAQIADLIKSCIEEMKFTAKKKGLKLLFAKPKTRLPKINIDTLKIRQVILNLIDNAIKYTPKGEIKIEAKKKGPVIQIAVKDTGEGLTKEEKETIFEGFTRGRAGTAFFIEGAGLGLYVAKKYLDLHQGKIWAESEGRGKGSVFYVELPIK